MAFPRADYFSLQSLGLHETGLTRNCVVAFYCDPLIVSIPQCRSDCLRYYFQLFIPFWPEWRPRRGMFDTLFLPPDGDKLATALMMILALKSLGVEHFSIVESLLLVELPLRVVEIIRMDLMLFDEVFTEHFDGRDCLHY